MKFVVCRYFLEKMKKGYLKNDKGNFLGMKTKLRKLISDRYIKMSIDDEDFIDSILELLDNRHEIMHGKLKGLLNMRVISYNDIHNLNLVYFERSRCI